MPARTRAEDGRGDAPAGSASAGAARAGRLAGSRAGALAVFVVLAPAALFAHAAGALGTPRDPVGWAGASALDDAGRVTATVPPGEERTLVLRPSSGGVSYTLTGGHGPTVVDAAGAPTRPAAVFLAAVVADLTVGGGWGAAALPSLGAGAVFVPAAAAGSAAAGGVGSAAAASASVGAAPGAAGIDEPASPAGRLVDALDASDGLERGQTTPDGYTWRLAPAAGPAAEMRLLSPGLAAAARTGPAGSAAGGAAGSVAAARAAAVDRVATGPGAAVAPVGMSPGRPAPVRIATDGLVPAGPAGRLLVLAEPADAGWRVSMAGRPLTPVAAWGWAQAFEVPAGPAGEARVSYDHGPHRVLVAVEAAVAGAVALGWASSRAWGRWRRRRDGAAVWWAGR